MFETASKIVVLNPSVGRSPAGFRRVHLELPPKQVGRIIGYDPRTLVMKPRRARVPKGTRDLTPRNVSQQVVDLQNKVQRSIDHKRVAQMVDYLCRALDGGEFADWGPIELVTSSEPSLVRPGEAELDTEADYFIADGQHRYCALLDLMREFPVYADQFTQGVTLSILPDARLEDWAGQKFHDHNYYSVPVRAGKALAVDTRDPINSMAKELDEHPVIAKAGGIAYDRDTLLSGDSRFTSHSVMHRFVRGFLFGRPGLDKTVDTRAEMDNTAKEQLWQYITMLGNILPWYSRRELTMDAKGKEAEVDVRDSFLTRTSVMLAALAVVGHDLRVSEMPADMLLERLRVLATIDWRRTNLALVGVVGSERGGVVQPASSRQAIDSTIRYLRERLGLLKHPNQVGNGN